MLEMLTCSGVIFPPILLAVSFCKLAAVLAHPIIAPPVITKKHNFTNFDIRERTRNGLNAARMEGRVGGRRPKLKPHQEQEIVRMVSSGQKTAADAARLFSVHPATISRLLTRSK